MTLNMVESAPLTPQQQLTGRPKEAPQAPNVRNNTSSYTIDTMRIYTAGASGRVRNTNTGTKLGEDADLPVPKAEVKSPKVVHGRPSPSSREPSPKKHKGKQKETSREILEEVLNNLEDEMVCPMSGSERRLHHNHALTFTILDAVTFCKRQRICIHDAIDTNCSTAPMHIWVTLAGTLSAENAGGAGSIKT